MSYARFGWDGSDVYVYLDVGGYLTCCSCTLMPALPSGFHEWFKVHSTSDMLAHLGEHLAAGHIVTDDTLEHLAEDQADTDARIQELLAEAGR